MINLNNLIGVEVRNKNNERGTIINIEKDTIEIDFAGEHKLYKYPDVFQKGLRVEDEVTNSRLKELANKEKINNFLATYNKALQNEIMKIKFDGGKKYHAVDGVILSKIQNIYLFDVDTEIIISDDIKIDVFYKDEKINGKILDYSDYQIKIQIDKNIGSKVKQLDFIIDESYLLDKLKNQICDMTLTKGDIAYDIVCDGDSSIQKNKSILKGQNNAFSKATSDRITFIWGPPGTGKTRTLSEIAHEFLLNKKRVLMVSYSNVSVDEAVLRCVDRMNEKNDGRIIRYGNTKSDKIQKSNIHSYHLALERNPEFLTKYNQIVSELKKLEFEDSERQKLNKELNELRSRLKYEEIKIVKQADFVATTITKAIIDKNIYNQKFDVVIFDEASMAYVPQVVFAASLAKSNFICLGDFCQLPAISLSNNSALMRDIFEFSKIKEAVSNNCGHKWLVMLYEQYRMHEEISDFVKEYMYNNLLETNIDTQLLCSEIASNPPFENNAVCLVDLKYLYSVCKDKINDSSRINILSAMISIKIAEKYISEHSVGIITPFNAQCRMIVSILRDLSQKDDKYKNIRCATVHQFQGSECPIIIYDSVDSYGVKYISTLISSAKENDNANRLFNVAMTRAKGKFIMLANTSFLKDKSLSKSLLFYKALKLARCNNSVLSENVLLNTIKSDSNTDLVYVDNKANTFAKYLEDLQNAEESICIDFPGEIEDDDEYISALMTILENKVDNVELSFRKNYDVTLPFGDFENYCKSDIINFPVTIIDKEIIWFGQPLFDDEITLKNSTIDVMYYPCFRVQGKYGARIISNFLEM